nr:hypothetical protein [Algoriphagus sp.]
MTTAYKNYGKVETDKFWDDLKSEYFRNWETDDLIIQGNGKDGVNVYFIPKKEMRKLLKLVSKQKTNGFA